MATTFHPQVYRGQPGPTLPHPVVGQAEFPTSRSSPSSSSSASAAPTHLGEFTPLTSTTSHSSHAQAYAHLPTFGLKPPSHEYPLHPSSEPNCEYKLITAKQYAQLAYEHASKSGKLDEKVLFPWLHGADARGSAQAANFGFVKGKGCEVPRYRGLVTIAAHACRDQILQHWPAPDHVRDSTVTSIASSVSAQSFSSTSTSVSTTPTHVSSTEAYATPSSSSVTRSVSSTTTGSTTSSSSSSGDSASSEGIFTPARNMQRNASSSASSLGDTSFQSQGKTEGCIGIGIDMPAMSNDRPPLLLSSTPAESDDDVPARTGPEPLASLLSNSWLPSELLSFNPSHHPSRAAFHPAIVPAGVSFRNYRMQPAKMASISDIVVYSDRGAFAQESIDIAKRAKAAIIKCEADRRARGEHHVLSYEVFVIVEPFRVIERNHPELVGTTSSGWLHNSTNFAQAEHDQMRAFTSATEIAENIYIGNTFDVPMPLDERAAMSPNPSAVLAAAHADENVNQHGFSIVIEARDMAHMADMGQLRERERWLDNVQAEHASERQRKMQEARSVLLSQQSWRGQDGRSLSMTSDASSSSYGSTSSSPTSSDSEMTEDDDIQRTDLTFRPELRAMETPTIAAFIADDLSDTSDYDEFFDASDKENCPRSPPRSPRRHGLRDKAKLARLPASLALSSYTYEKGSGPLKTQFKRHSRTLSAMAAATAAAAASAVTLPSPAAASRARQAKRQEHAALRAQRRADRRAAKAAIAADIEVAAAQLQLSEGEVEHESGEVLKANLNEIVHLEALSTAQTLPNPNAQWPILVDAIVDHVIWLRAQARPHLRTSVEQRATSLRYLSGSAKIQADTIATEAVLPRRVLIHCADGYTDISVLALTYIMYDRVCSLPEAYLHLQNDKQRSFFVYPTDVKLLKSIERRVESIVKAQGRSKYNDDLSKEQIAEIDRQELEAKRRVDANAAATAVAKSKPSPARSAVAAYLSRPSLFSRTSSSMSTATIRATLTGSTASSPTSPSFPGSATGPDAASLKISSHSWFYDERFDGHFPSRVLDHLYLGNLHHASNALMLKELGITHVLSIGETALIPPANQQQGCSNPDAASRGRTPTNSLWLEQTLGNIQVLDIQNIQDDGSDSILPHIVKAVEFINSAKQSGGKALVHCRVGVSRSATLVIAYVMHELDLSLADAYLLVRARRLNILIQPTILFMWTLHAWEEEIRGSGINDDSKLDQSRAGRLSWPILSVEIANLNQKYLNC